MEAQEAGAGQTSGGVSPLPTRGGCRLSRRTGWMAGEQGPGTVGTAWGSCLRLASTEEPLTWTRKNVRSVSTGQ